VGIGFKLALVPFHMWTGDVYQGAPAPVTTAIATVSKISVFAFFLRFLHCTDIAGHSGLYWLLVSIASASILFGNWLALFQNNVKRLLAYSSIAHFGYLLIPLIAGGAHGVNTACFYLVAYTIATLGSFGVVAVLSRPEREADDINDYTGLAWRRPLLSCVFIVMLFSLAGVPLTAGFLAKFFIVTTAVGSSLWLLSGMLVAGSALGVFFYLRLIAVQVTTPEAGANAGARQAPAFYEQAVLALLVLLQLALGVYPQPLLALIESVSFVAR
jgi:NADH-quinone oxidoreductase subunit N